MISVAGVTISVFMEFLLMSKKNKSISDKILIVWMFLIAVQQFLVYLQITKEIQNYPGLYGYSSLISMLWPVMLYLYVGTMTNQMLSRKKLALLFLPTAILALYLILTFIQLPGVEKLYIVQNERQTALNWKIVDIGIVSLGMFYIACVSWLLNKHKANIMDHFSDTEKINLRWLQLLTLGMGAIFIMSIIDFNFYVIAVSIVVFLFLMGFFGIRQGNIFTQHNSMSVSQGQNEKTGKSKYEKSTLTKEQSEEYLSTINLFMEKEKPFLESKITLLDISQRLDIHPNHLSQVINEYLNVNFHDFVNGYRVELVKEKILDPANKHLTLLALAYDCGFNSKSSFNSIFKKITGATPSQYLREEAA